MSDNKQIKDGLGNLFSVRMKDRSGDGVLMQSYVLASVLPLEYGAGGIYQKTVKSGTMAAGMVGDSPIYAFRYPALAPFCLVTRVRMNFWLLTAFSAAGIARFEMFVARSFTAPDTGGAAAVLTGNNGKLRTSMASSQTTIQYGNTGALTPGTRTLSADPIDAMSISVGTSAPAAVITPTNATLFQKLQGEHPLFLAQNEGFVIQGTVPAGGTWGYSVTTEWMEVTLY